MSVYPRGRCASCGAEVAVRRDGAAWTHLDLRVAPEDGFHRCAGSGRPVAPRCDHTSVLLRRGVLDLAGWRCDGCGGVVRIEVEEPAEATP